MKRWALLLGVIGIAAWTGPGCAPSPGVDGGNGVAVAVAADAASAKDLEVRKKLQARLRAVDFDNTEFAAVMDWLRQTAKVDIQVKWAPLESAGITTKTLVASIHLSDVTAEAALRVLLDDVGGTTPLAVQRN